MYDHILDVIKQTEIDHDIKILRFTAAVLVIQSLTKEKQLN